MSSVRVGPLTLFTKTCTILVFAAETLSPGCSKSVPTSKQPRKKGEDPSVAAGEPSKGSHGLSPRQSVVSPLTSDRCPRRAVSRAATTAIEGEHRQHGQKDGTRGSHPHDRLLVPLLHHHRRLARPEVHFHAMETCTSSVRSSGRAATREEETHRRTSGQPGHFEAPANPTGTCPGSEGFRLMLVAVTMSSP